MNDIICMTIIRACIVKNLILNRLKRNYSFMLENVISFAVLQLNLDRVMVLLSPSLFATICLVCFSFIFALILAFFNVVKDFMLVVYVIKMYNLKDIGHFALLLKLVIYVVDCLHCFLVLAVISIHACSSFW
jgi:hypothetical protein